MIYQYGYRSQLKQELSSPGLNIETIKYISKANNEPIWLLEWRIESYYKWEKMQYPSWSNLSYNIPNFDKIIFHSKTIDTSTNISTVYNKLGIDLKRKDLAIEAVLDSKSVYTSCIDQLKDKNIIFKSLGQAIIDHPELVKQYLGSVVSNNDNYFASLNSCVFSDGSFVYIPENVQCPLELSTYFRINTKNIGQFERTLIIAEKNSYVSYLEGCTAAISSDNQLHAAVVEIVCLENATVKYSTVQNWYPGDKMGNGGIYNFVTKRGIAHKNAKISWLQVETGSSITWKYPSIILLGDNSKGEFQSLSITNNKQQADTGTKIWHIGKNTSSFIESKSIAGGSSNNTYRSLVSVNKNADYATNFTKCDALILGDDSCSYNIPTIRCNNSKSNISHEAFTSFIGLDKIFYLMQRGMSIDQACSLIASGFSKSILTNLPLEFAVEAKELLQESLKGATG